MAKTQQVPEEQIENQVSGFEKFVKKYQKILGWAIIAALIVVFAALAINKWYLTPAREEARAQMFPAEQQFAHAEYATALEGDGNFPGFAQLISDYGSKCGEAVYLYAGICAYNLERYDEAIGYLKQYNGKDKILKAKALCATGDCYAAKDDKAAALSFFKKAAAVEDNLYRATYLFKAGIMAEEMGNDAEALGFYEEIQARYPQSAEGYEAARYISRIQNK